MTDDRTAHDTQDQRRRRPPPELADWWVWGVRRIAAPIADLLLAALRPPAPLSAFLKGATWAFTRDPNELRGAGAALSGLVALFGPAACCSGRSPQSGTHRIPSGGWIVIAGQSAGDLSPGSAPMTRVPCYTVLESS